MSFFEIFGMVFMGILVLNAAIGIWAIKTAKANDSVEFSHSQTNLRQLKISRI
jgi:hypothetical protein